VTLCSSCLKVSERLIRGLQISGGSIAANQYRNLNQWVANLPTDAVVTGADDINDSGLILARYKVNGVLRNCLLVPDP
jgi:hypothetical protein